MSQSHKETVVGLKYELSKTTGSRNNHKRITGDGTCNGRNDMEDHRPRPRNKLAAVAAHNKQMAERHTPFVV